MVQILKSKLFFFGSGVSVLLLMGAGTGVIRWDQINHLQRNGTDAFGQSSDGTHVPGNIPTYDSLGGLTQTYGAQGSDSNLLTAGTVSGTGASLCTDANGGATTVSCSGGGGGSTTAGTFASLPGSPTSGQLYLFTNSIYDSAWYDGSNWHYLIRGMEATPPSGFATQNAATSVLTTVNGGENIRSSLGAGGANITGRYVAYPTPPFTRTVGFKFRSIPNALSGSTNSAANATAGLYVSDGTKVEYICLYGFGQELGVQFGPSVTSITTNVVLPANGSQSIGDLVWFRFDDGVTTSGKRTFWVSYDNVNFIEFYQETNTANLTPTRIGYFASAFDTNTFSTIWAFSWQ